jgi:hypothetical protein
MNSEAKEVRENSVMEAASWTKIGEHSNRTVLKKTVAKIRAKWLDRYVFRILKCDENDKGFELHLKHR